MGSHKTGVEGDGLGDWRLQAATRLAADLPAAYVGGPAHKAGTALILTMMADAPGHARLAFPTPSAPALALSAGFRSAELAAQLWPQVTFSQTLTPEGPGEAVAAEHVGTLFAYFEACIAAANSSFQAIEAFANETIARLLTGTMELPRRNGPELMTAEQIERTVATDEKLGTVLPKLLNLAPIKGQAEWELFKKLKDVRDASTHFKSGDQYPSNGTASNGSLYYLLLNTDPRQYPVAAVRVISRLLAGAGQPRWLTHLAEKHAVTTTGRAK